MNNNIVEFIEGIDIIEYTQIFFFGKNRFGNKINKTSKISNRYHYKGNLRKHIFNFEK